MSTPPPRSARPWLALLVGVAVVAGVLAVLSQGDDEPSTDGGNPVRVGRGNERDTDLPANPDSDRSGPDASEPEPLVGTDPSDPELEPYDEFEGLTTVFGRVEDMLGRPLADLEVNLFTDLGDYLDTTVSGEDGGFAFELYESLNQGWSVGTGPDLMADPELPGALGPSTYVHRAPLNLGDPAVEVLLKVSAAPRLEGRVIDVDTRQPPIFSQIEIVSLLPGWVDRYQSTFAEEDGMFGVSLVDLPLTGIVVRIMDENDQTTLLGPFDLAPGEVRWLEIELGAARTLSGRVIDAHTAAPIEGAQVQVLPLHDAFDTGETWAISDDDGSYEIDFIQTPAQQTWLYVESMDYCPVLMNVPQGREQMDVPLAVSRLLTGRLTMPGPGGEPVPVLGAMVRAVLRGPGGRLLEDYEDVTFSDDEGRYELMFELVPPEAAELFITSDETELWRGTLADISAVKLAANTTLDLNLQPLPGF